MFFSQSDLQPRARSVRPETDGTELVVGYGPTGTVLLSARVEHLRGEEQLRRATVMSVQGAALERSAD